MPQFDISTFPSQILWLILSFSVVFLFMWRVGLPKISTTLESRQRKISDDLTKAKELAVEADEVLEAYEAKLSEARANAQEEIHRATALAAADNEKRNNDLGEMLSANAVAARDRIDQETKAATENITPVAEEIAQKAVEQLIDITPNINDVKLAVSESLKERTT